MRILSVLDRPGLIEESRDEISEIIIRKER